MSRDRRRTRVTISKREGVFPYETRWKRGSIVYGTAWETKEGAITWTRCILLDPIIIDKTGEEDRA